MLTLSRLICGRRGRQICIPNKVIFTRNCGLEGNLFQVDQIILVVSSSFSDRMCHNGVSNGLLHYLFFYCQQLLVALEINACIHAYNALKKARRTRRTTARLYDCCIMHHKNRTTFPQADGQRDGIIIVGWWGNSTWRRRELDVEWYDYLNTDNSTVHARRMGRNSDRSGDEKKENETKRKSTLFAAVLRSPSSSSSSSEHRRIQGRGKMD